jgi:hypothetical protein
MTPDDFRALALSLPEAVESAHMNHPDFRVGKKIFATLGYPNKESGCVMLLSADQLFFVKEHPSIFTPSNGAWGRGGATVVNLKKATKPIARKALQAAHAKIATSTRNPPR